MSCRFLYAFISHVSQPFQRPILHRTATLRSTWIPHRRLSIRKLALLAVPATGLVVLYVLPPQRRSSKTQPPPSSPRYGSSNGKIDYQRVWIASPSEPELPILDRLFGVLRARLLNPILTGKRFIYLLLLFFPVVLTTPLLLLGPRLKKHGGERWGAVWWYSVLTKQMKRAGPTFVKLGQWAASRTDLFSAALCERMGTLHSHGKPHSLQHTIRVIEHVFLKPIEEVFEIFDCEPIGVGAIAQVYRATLRKDLLPPSHLGPKRTAGAHLPMPYPLPFSFPTASVAIKVLHPGVEALISQDLSIMRFIAHTLSLLPGMEWLSLPEEVEVFGSMMNEQLNMMNEVSNLCTFENNFENRKAAVSFPRPLSKFSTKDILVSEFQYALPLESFLGNGGGPFDKQIAQIGLDAFLNMLLLDNFVHSDLHPGNIMVKFYKPSTRFILQGICSSLFKMPLPSDTLHPGESDAIVTRLRTLTGHPAEWNAELQKLANEGYQPELVFIDTGLVTVLDEKNRQNFIDLFAAIAQFDGYKAGKLMVDRCRTPELAVDPETFALKIQHLTLKVKQESFSLAQIRISTILSDVLKAVREHHVKMEADFINTVLSILLLEGIGRQLDPNLDLFRSSLPILRKLGRQMSLKESFANLPKSRLGAILKVWVWAETRSLASSLFLDTDYLVRYDLVAPNI